MTIALSGEVSCFVESCDQWTTEQTVQLSLSLSLSFSNKLRSHSLLLFDVPVGISLLLFDDTGTGLLLFDVHGISLLLFGATGISLLCFDNFLIAYLS